MAATNVPKAAFTDKKLDFYQENKQTEKKIHRLNKLPLSSNRVVRRYNNNLTRHKKKQNKTTKTSRKKSEKNWKTFWNVVLFDFHNFVNSQSRNKNQSTVTLYFKKKTEATYKVVKLKIKFHRKLFPMLSICFSKPQLRNESPMATPSTVFFLFFCWGYCSVS